MSKAGEFIIDVSSGGYPVWCRISYLGEQIVSISHTELSDLEYAVKKAMYQAKMQLQPSDRWEVDQ